MGGGPSFEEMKCAAGDESECDSKMDEEKKKGNLESTPPNRIQLSHLLVPEAITSHLHLPLCSRTSSFINTMTSCLIILPRETLECEDLLPFGRFRATTAVTLVAKKAITFLQWLLSSYFTIRRSTTHGLCLHNIISHLFQHSQSSII